MAVSNPLARNWSDCWIRIFRSSDHD